jgi:hypothetical protein
MGAEMTILYRPLGPRELDLIREANWSRFPPRLPEQPVFYPLLNEEYARQIASASWTLRAPPLLKRPSATRSKRSALGHRTLLRNSSSVTRMSLMICRKSGGAISRPEWKGTVVPLPSGCRNWRCAPRWRTSTKPRRSSARITSRGLRTGTRDIRFKRR